MLERLDRSYYAGNGPLDQDAAVNRNVRRSAECNARHNLPAYRKLILSGFNLIVTESGAALLALPGYFDPEIATNITIRKTSLSFFRIVRYARCFDFWRDLFFCTVAQCASCFKPNGKQDAQSVLRQFNLDRRFHSFGNEARCPLWWLIPVFAQLELSSSRV